MRKPNSRELKVLREFCMGFPEPWERFPDAGPTTKQSLLDEGWIELNTDPNYPPDYYQLTDLGDKAAYS